MIVDPPQSALDAAASPLRLAAAAALASSATAQPPAPAPDWRPPFATGPISMSKGRANIVRRGDMVEDRPGANFVRIKTGTCHETIRAAVC
jgi:hypothetical protein